MIVFVVWVAGGKLRDKALRPAKSRFLWPTVVLERVTKDREDNLLTHFTHPFKPARHLPRHHPLAVMLLRHVT